MTREEVKTILPILQAFAEGSTVEFKDRRFKDEWDEMSEFPDSSFKYFEFRIKPKLEYRIKPESTYRPFKDKEECWNEMLKHQPFGWVKSTLFKDLALVKRVTTLYVEINREIIDYKDVFDKFTFADGTNFGVKM